MAISKNSKMLQVALPSIILDAMDEACKHLSEQLGINVTKRMLIIHIFTKWVEDIKTKAERVEEQKEEKGNA